MRRGIERRGGEVSLALNPAFQGLPDAAHGGSVLAAFRLLADGAGPAAVRALYLKRVPLGVPLRVEADPRAAGVGYRLLDASATVLVEGEVAVAAPPETAAFPAPGPSGHPLPVSLTCLACGTTNEAGLQARLTFDDASVGGVWPARPALRADDGALSPLALTTLLDEAAFWLGALASGESGMTTDLRVALGDPVPFGTAIVVAGDRARVRQGPDDPRYWETTVTARDERGRLLAGARITFVAVRGAARRLVNGMLSVNPPEVVRRVFPAYTR